MFVKTHFHFNYDFSPQWNTLLWWDSAHHGALGVCKDILRRGLGGCQLGGWPEQGEHVETPEDAQRGQALERDDEDSKNEAYGVEDVFSATKNRRNQNRGQTKGSQSCGVSSYLKLFPFPKAPPKI